MRRRKWTVAAGSAIALALVVSGCSSGGDSSAEPTTGATNATQAPTGGTDTDGVLKFGYVLPETGQLAFLGPPQIAAMNYAIDLINKAGGVNGQPIPDPVTGDEAGDQAVAVQSAERVLNAGVDAVIGAAASGMSLAIIDKVTGANVVQCSGSNTAPTFTDYNDNGFYFRTAPSDALQGPVLADVVTGDGGDNVAVIARADDYGKGLANATADALSNAGATVALNETYDPNTTNFDAIVQKVVAAKPNAVVVVAFAEGAQIIKALIENGLSPDKVGIYGADGLRSAELGKLVNPSNPAAVAGMKGTAPASADNPEFTAALKAFAPDLKELQFAPQIFDCVNLIALAAEQAKTDDPNVYKDKIVGLTKPGGEECSTFEACKKIITDGKQPLYKGASGNLNFTDKGEPASATIEVYGYDNTGTLKSLETKQSEPIS